MNVFESAVLQQDAVPDTVKERNIPLFDALR